MIRILFIFIVLGMAPLAVAAADDAELEAVRKKFTGMFESVEPENIKPSPVDGWYVIAQPPIVAYVSADGRYLLQGDIIDLDRQENISELSRANMRRDVMADVADDEVIRFSPAEVKYSISVFTDIDCTYCRKLHAQIDEYMANGIEVRYLLYPRNGPASRSWNTAQEVWCSNDRNHALTMAKLEKNFVTQKCESSMVGDHFQIGRDIGLSGTPAILLDDGTMIGGYLTPAQLTQRLEANAANSP